MEKHSQYELLEALTIARWQMLLNSMRADRSKRQDTIAKIILGLLFAVATLTVGVGLGAMTYTSSTHGRSGGVVAALWVIFGLWMFAQVGASATTGLNFREIARYPVSFRLFCLLQAAYALLEPATLAASFWLLCVWIALFFARPALVDRSVPLLAGFWLATLLLNRLVAELLERFTSTKKGRRRFIGAMIGFSFFYQFWVFGSQRIGRSGAAMFGKMGTMFSFLPPSIAGQGAQGGSLAMAGAGLAAYVVFLGLPLLWIYLRKYQGELLSDAPAPGGQRDVPPGWRFPLLSNTISALVEKEFRYTMSQPLGFLNCAYGPLMALLMALGMARSFQLHRDFMFPFVMGWVILMIGGRAYNAFGFDITGFNRYLLAPLNMRQVIGSKNLLVALLLALNFLGIAVVLAWVAPFSSGLFFIVLAGFLFTTLTTLAAGNFMSVRFPMGVDLETLRARNASTTGQLSNLATQIMIVGALAAVFYLKLPALPVFVILTIASAAFYWSSLDSAARYAESHSEEIARSLGETNS